MSSHTLTFSQLVGSFTVDKDLIGAQDPYIVFQAGGNKCQTKAIKSVGAGTCEWKETYELKEFSAKGAVKEAASKASSTHSNSSTILEVTAYNHNTLVPDGAIGSGTVDLARLGGSQLSGSGDRTTVHLTDKKGKSVGEVKFLIHGGGYQGAGSSSTGHGVGSGVGGAGVGSGVGSGIGHSGHSSDRNITGVGEGPTHGGAHQAARKAAHEGQDVNLQTREGVAHGHPTGAGQHTGSHGIHDQSRGQVGHTASGVRGVDVGQGEVIDRKYYTSTEDRPQEQALVEQYREHNPYTKEYETSVQHTGRERQVGSSIEALGTQERVVDTHHHVHGAPHEEIARALPRGAIDQRPGGEGWVQGKAGPVCDTTKFEVAGDRTVDKERVTNLREHREFEKEFEVKTALVGERAHNVGEVEQLNRERILLDEKKKVACDGHPTVEAGGVGSHATTHHSATGGQTTGSRVAEGVRDATTGHGTHSHGTTGQGLTSGTHGTSGHGLPSGTHGTSGQGLTSGQGYTPGGTSGQGLTSGTHGTSGHGLTSGTHGQTGTTQDNKGVFQKVKEAVTGQPKTDSTY